MGEIERNIVKQGKRNAICRLVRAKSDKRRVTDWNTNLDGILQALNVHPATSVLPSLNSRTQTELTTRTPVMTSNTRHEAVNTLTIVSDVHNDVSNTHLTVSEVHATATNTHTTIASIRNDVVNISTVTPPDVHQGDVHTHATTSELQHNVTGTQIIVSDIHCTTVESHAGNEDENQSVSMIHTPPMTEESFPYGHR
jgi:hypothetical protein